MYAIHCIISTILERWINTRFFSFVLSNLETNTIECTWTYNILVLNCWTYKYHGVSESFSRSHVLAHEIQKLTDLLSRNVLNIKLRRQIILLSLCCIRSCCISSRVERFCTNYFLRKAMRGTTGLTIIFYEQWQGIVLRRCYFCDFISGRKWNKIIFKLRAYLTMFTFCLVATNKKSTSGIPRWFYSFLYIW